ncbi:MAG: high frequency lysogenization protein HflD [Halieaceae bacterium]
MNQQEQQVLALAGVVQAARLVDEISRTGSYPEEFLSPTINSLFKFDAADTADVYGGVGGVKLGLQNLAAMLASRDADNNREMARYVFGLLHLEKRFSSTPEMVSIVRSRLEHAQFKSEYFSTHVQEVSHSLAGIYQDTISTFRFRVTVTGNMKQLSQQKNADMIRALLLAGIRSAFLWRQLGGRRWQLLMRRRKIQQVAQNLSRQLASV